MFLVVSRLHVLVWCVLHVECYMYNMCMYICNAMQCTNVLQCNAMQYIYIHNIRMHMHSCTQDNWVWGPAAVGGRDSEPLPTRVSPLQDLCLEGAEILADDPGNPLVIKHGVAGKWTIKISDFLI